VTRLSRMCDMTHGAILTPIDVVNQSMLQSVLRVSQNIQCSMKRALNSIKRALYSIKRALDSTPSMSSNTACFSLFLESLNRDVYSIKRALYLSEKPYILPQRCRQTKHALVSFESLSKETYILSKEPNILSKETTILS